MRSQFSNSKRVIKASAVSQVDEVYDLKGLNQVSPDQIMSKGESPFNLNARMYARNVDDTRVAIKTRKGSINFSTPVGQVANVQNVATVTGDDLFSSVAWIATPFTPNASGLLTQLDLWVKRFDGASGPVIVEIRSNLAGAPGQQLAQSSINVSQLLLTYQYLPALFIDAPALVNGTQYWIVVHTQVEGQGNYALGQTAASGGLTSNSSGGAWVAGPVFRYRSYLSTAGKVKGITRRNPADAQYRTIIAQGTNLYAIPDNPAVPASISSTISALSTRVRFDQINDLTFYTDEFSQLKQNDGTTETIITQLSGTPSNVIAHKNRLFVVKDKVRVEFSGLFNFTDWPSVNFFYVGNPKSPDPITGWAVFQDNLIIFTRDTKYILSGSDIGTFTMKQAVGTKGAVSQEAMWVDRNYIYFLSPDGTVNRFNGISDELISDKLQPEFSSIQNIDDSTLTVHENQVRIYYSKAPNTLVTYMALFDTIYEQWFVDTGRPVSRALPIKMGNNTNLIEVSATAGWLFIGETGNSDLGKAIDFKYWTPYKAYASGASKKRIKKFYPVLRASQARYSMKVGVDFDFLNKPAMNDYAVNGTGTAWGGGKTWGGGDTWGSTSLVDNQTPVSGRAKHIQYRFEKKGVDTPIEMYGYIILYKQGRAR